MRLEATAVDTLGTVRDLTARPGEYMAVLEIMIVHLREFSRDHRELVWLASSSPRLRGALWMERAQCLEAIEAWKCHEADLFHDWQEEYDLHNYLLDQEESPDSENDYPRFFNGPPPPMRRFYIYAGLPASPPRTSLTRADY